MAHKKAGGSAKNLTKRNPQFLGIKLYGGETARGGNIIVRQRGSKITAGRNTDIGKDHTIFAVKDGIVTYKNKRRTRYDGRIVLRKVVEVL